MVYMITYDLNSPGQSYDDIVHAIQECSDIQPYSCWRSSFLIQSARTADEIARSLLKNSDSNDRFFVAEVTSNYQGLIPKADWDYVNAMFR